MRLEHAPSVMAPGSTAASPQLTVLPAPAKEWVPPKPQAQHKALSPDETGAGATSVLARYRRQALALDGGAALLGALTALTARFGVDPPALYLAAAAALPAVWVGIVALYRGYENRFLGTDSEEYRRVINAGPLLFVSIAV